MDRNATGRESKPVVNEIEKGAIRRFAEALGETNPIYFEEAAARAAGYRNVVAPPTFPVVITGVAMDRVLFDPELGLNYAMVVHGEQRFAYTRPVTAGDVLAVEMRLTNIRAMAGNDILTVEAEVTDESGAHVVTATGVIVSRGTATEG